MREFIFKDTGGAWLWWRRKVRSVWEEYRYWSLIVVTMKTSCAVIILNYDEFIYHIGGRLSLAFCLERGAPQDSSIWTRHTTEYSYSWGRSSELNWMLKSIYLFFSYSLKCEYILIMKTRSNPSSSCAFIRSPNRAYRLDAPWTADELQRKPMEN